MRNILENYSNQSNFWETNPQFTAINPFKKLWKGDKSKNKADSSTLMWAIALMYMPTSDLYYTSNKEEIIGQSMLNVKTIDIDSFWESKKELVDAFIDMTLTQAEKSLISWEKRLKQRDAFLEGQVYTFGYIDADGVEYRDNTKSLDDMGSKTGKFYEEFFKIKKELKEEEAVSRNKKIKSSTANGEI